MPCRPGPLDSRLRGNDVVVWVYEPPAFFCRSLGLRVPLLLTQKGEGWIYSGNHDLVKISGSQRRVS